MKVWTSYEKGDDKIIVFSNEIIYKANPKVTEIDNYLFDLKLQKIPSKKYFGIPLSYISEINQQEGKKYIEILFRSDTEHFRISDDKIRNEIFEHFKQNIPGTTHSVISQTKLQAVKKPLIAIAVIVVIFSLALYIAKGMEDGMEYDVVGQKYHSVSGIILLIASLGVNRILLISGSLLLIAGFRFVKNYKNPVVKSTLTIRQ